MSARLCALALVVLASAGCESAIVGADCRAPLVSCGHVCTDISTDLFNCGTCGNTCNAACVGGRCVGIDAAVLPDGGRDAGPPRDAGMDAGRDAAASPDANVPDSGVDAPQPVDAGPLRCGVGQLLCGASCLDSRGGDTCGDCTTSCDATEVCAPGGCAADCGALSACGASCVDLTNDTHHCGDCATDCGTRVCLANVCIAASDGHVIVIGHDYETHRMEMSQVLANAVLLPTRATVRVLAYQGGATATSISGANAALAEAAAGRGYMITSAPSAADVTVALADADTFLMYAEANASDSSLRALGYEWGLALEQFLARGGVIVQLEAPSLVNAGTYQILQSASLFQAISISEVITPRLVAATGRATDSVIAGILFPYSGERHTVAFTTSDPDAVVTTGSQGVVFHRVINN